ncbi:hypothetical protein SCHPADRAFT_988617 [Schizopora paradoxa]|uniref:Uncharacterized protein n=1 Tax=Schizopora paradoxa TaxID=27342 RepID=A0A0H2R0S8_9AGAM|nr:hypothetical protein SCHPADRAFT_988617 [Schizopora paradoxa]
MCGLASAISTSSSIAQNLPDDILYAIFLQALPSVFYLSTLAHQPWMVPSFTFSLVCRSWRTLVLSRPTLWSRIHVESRSMSVDYECDSRDPIIYRILKRWLSLSSPAPLWVHIDLSEELEDVYETILSLFVEEYLRWDLFHINVDYWRRPSSSVSPIFTLRGFAPVTSIYLRLFGSHSPAVVVDLSCFIGDRSSRLEHLSVAEGATVRLPMDGRTLRLPRLRSLCFESIHECKNLDDLRCILSASPNLDSLKLRISGDSVSPSTLKWGPLHLPHLTSLSLTTPTRFATNYIFNTITCPSISELRFKNLLYNDFEDLEVHALLQLQDIQDLLARSSNKSMEFLSLDWDVDDATIISNHAPALRDLLLSLPSLKTLELHKSALNDAVLEILTVPSGGQVEPLLCPLPFEISISNGSITDLTGKAVEEMIVSRWKAGALRSVNLQFEHSRFGKIIERDRIQECIREGLVVVDIIMEVWGSVILQLVFERHFAFFFHGETASVLSRSDATCVNFHFVVVDLSSFITDRFSHLEYLSVTEGATEGENVDGLRRFVTNLTINMLTFPSVRTTPALTLLKFVWRSSLEPPLSSHTTALRDFLAYLRNLGTLQLHGFVLDRGVIELLTVPSGGHFEFLLCPSLSNISISFSTWVFPDFTSKTLEDMVVLRWKAGAIREMTLRFYSSEFGNFGERNRVRECVREGLGFEATELKY